MGPMKFKMNKRGWIDWELIRIIFTIFFIILLVIGSVVFVINLGIREQCRREANIMGLDWKYNFWIDCMINVDNKWINMDNYIINEEKK